MGTRILLLLVISLGIVLLLLLFLLYAINRKRTARRLRRRDSPEDPAVAEALAVEPEGLIGFDGGEDLTAEDVLEAPGEVVGKSGYGTLYRAALPPAGGAALLRFVRPASGGRTEEIIPAVRTLGLVRHPNLVPMWGLYVGPRGEKLFVHPFYSAGNLSQFLRDGNAESHRWEVIYKLSLGIARGLDHLHNGSHRPIIHGNLKTKNVLLDTDHQSRLSDFGLHLLLNPTAGQEMLEASSAEGYKAPELIKMKDASVESDIYGLGVILLEIISQREPINGKEHDLHLPSSLRTSVLESKCLELICPQICQNSRREDLLMYFQLATACCSPSPVLRPDIKRVVRKLEEIGR